MPLNSPIDEHGALFVVATPIGNLEDVTYRAVRVLREADMVLAEDTRLTKKLLAAHEIFAPLLSLHEHNEEDRTPMVLKRIRSGQRVALVSDAGTPGISDPGFHLVREAAAAGFTVHPIPGPSAAIAALSVSGLPTDTFLFAGFLPKKAARRRQKLELLDHVPATLIFYESPHRISDLLKEAAEILGDREAVLAREVTKLHEEFLRGTLKEIGGAVAERTSVKGECTLLVAGAPEIPPSDEKTVESAVRQGLADRHLSASRLAAEIAREHNVPKSHVYEMILRMRSGRQTN
ncbi:MAG: 16S rRNA (cytidine(1402)-2'-O)-methyltransferase [Desulfatibacillaceae bacterium]